MVRLACTKEQDDPTGVEYRVGDAIDLPVLGSFDLVTAVYLLNYAMSKDQMLGMCRSAYDNLVAGGRFIAYTVNPAYTLSKPNGAKYGSYFRHMTPEEIGMSVTENSLPSHQPPTSASSGAGRHTSRQSKRQGSGRSPGTLPRYHPKTWRIMVQPIGRISTIIVSSSGWSARSDSGHPPDDRGSLTVVRGVTLCCDDASLRC